MGWNGNGYQLAECSSGTWILLRDCIYKEACQAPFVEFKERKTHFRAVMLGKEVAASLRVGLNILFGQVSGCS